MYGAPSSSPNGQPWSPSPTAGWQPQSSPYSNPATATVASPPTQPPYRPTNQPYTGQIYSPPAAATTIPTSSSSQMTGSNSSPFPDNPASDSFSDHSSSNSVPASLSRRHVSSAAPASTATPGSSVAPGISRVFTPSKADLDDLSPASIARYLLQPQFILQFIGILLFFFIATVPFVFFASDSTTQVSPATEIYCSNGQHAGENLAHLLPSWQPRCVHCPAHGTCSGGKMMCNSGYFQVYHDCIASSGFAETGNQLKERLIAQLEIHAGLRLCGDTSTPGAPSPDLTITELKAYVTPFHPTQEESIAFDRAWQLAAQWINNESILNQNYRPAEHPYHRLITINSDPKQPIRYRAAFPRRSLTCRLKDTTSREFGTILGYAAGFTLVTYLIILFYFVSRVMYHTRDLTQKILVHIREDYFVDYDATAGNVSDDPNAGLKHQAQNIADLKAEFLPKNDASSLLWRFVWSGVTSAMAKNSSIEKSSHAFQFGLAPSWKWIGPRPASSTSSTKAQGAGFGDARGHQL